MSMLPVLAVVAPLVAAVVVAARGWGRTGAAVSVAAPLVVLGCGLALCGPATGHLVRSGPLRVDALAAVMLLVIGAVGVLAAAASVGYLRREHAADRVDDRRCRRYGVLLDLFIAAMTVAVLADNLGVMWVAVEATTVVTAFLVGHRDTRAALEATWKYVVICSVGLTLAFLGTVLLYVASTHAGPGHDALGYEALLRRAPHLDHGVTRLAGVLLLLGYGTKVGLAPFHTWLADAHSQAPAPVSALMSGVLLSVAFTCLLRVKVVIDAAVGIGLMRNGMLTLALLTLAICAGLMLEQHDYKRLLAYSSVEFMALAALGASAATPLAVSAVLLLLIVHGLVKSVLFIGSGHLQQAHHSTSIAAVTGLLARNRELAVVLVAGGCVLIGLPPFGLFPSEVGIARAAAGAGLSWPLGVGFAFVLVAVTGVVRHGGTMLLGDTDLATPMIRLGRLDRTVLVAGLAGCLLLGITTAGLGGVLNSAGSLLAGMS